MAKKYLKKDHRRLALYDEQLLSAKPAARRRRPAARRKKKALPAEEAARLYSDTMRTARNDLRALLPDEAQLRRYGLPLWRTENDLAKALGVPLKELRFFSIHRESDRVAHYVSYTIAKPSGGRRLILAPKRRLKALQRRLLKLLVQKLPVSDHAHGYHKGRSIRSGAEPHVGRKVLLRIDLKDFFPTITFGRVRGLMVALGYGYRVAATLAALMTEAERQPVEVDGQLHFVPVGPRHTVQGAPTSPGLSNCILLRLDRRLAGLAQKFGFTYTRYADDLTFSSNEDAVVYRLRKAAEGIIKEEGFEVNPAKTSVARHGRCQRVTGVVVNEQLGLSRQERRRMRAAIHRLSQGLAAGHSLVEEFRRIEGKLAYLAMLNSEQAEALRRRLPSVPGA